VKKDGRREDFDREKLHRGIVRACEKRPVTGEAIEKMITAIEEKMRKKGNEVTSAEIGEVVSRELKRTDKVAYIRFSSVYREFADISDFKREIRGLVNS
jgi:transcriptional repressor NrdR